MDDKFGVPIQHPNGSISVPDGIIKDGMDGLADILLARLAIMYERHLTIDYLAPLENLANGIFVNKDSIQESHDFPQAICQMDMDYNCFIILDSYHQYCHHLQSFEPGKRKLSQFHGHLCKVS